MIRDHEGKIIAVAGRPLLLPKSVLGAEIMAILDGLTLCIKKNIAPASLFSDSLLAVKMIIDLVGSDNILDLDLRY